MNATQIGINNAREAVDQDHEYEDAFSSYMQNAGDTAIEQGLGHDGWADAQLAFAKEYTRLTGIVR